MTQYAKECESGRCGTLARQDEARSDPGGARLDSEGGATARHVIPSRGQVAIPNSSGKLGDYWYQTYPSLWSIELNRYHAQKADLRLDDFLEWK